MVANKNLKQEENGVKPNSESEMACKEAMWVLLTCSAPDCSALPGIICDASGAVAPRNLSAVQQQS